MIPTNPSLTTQQMCPQATDKVVYICVRMWEKSYFCMGQCKQFLTKDIYRNIFIAFLQQFDPIFPHTHALPMRRLVYKSYGVKFNSWELVGASNSTSMCSIGTRRSWNIGQQNQTALNLVILLSFRPHALIFFHFSYSCSTLSWICEARDGWPMGCCVKLGWVFIFQAVSVCSSYHSRKTNYLSATFKSFKLSF
jgi:hypothetical protein